MPSTRAPLRPWVANTSVATARRSALVRSFFRVAIPNFLWINRRIRLQRYIIGVTAEVVGSGTGALRQATRSAW
jgi:hypothetical protein